MTVNLPLSHTRLEVLLAEANKCIGEELWVAGHELIPVLILSHAVDIFADELEGLLAKH